MDRIKIGGQKLKESSCRIVSYGNFFLLFLLAVFIFSNAASAANVRYYLNATSGVNIGADGTTNVLTSGSNQIIPPIITALVDNTGTNTGIARSANHPTGLYNHSRWYFNSNYTSPTQIAPNCSGRTSLSGGSTNDKVTVRLYDYDPTTGLKNFIGSSSPITINASQASYNYTISSSAYIVPKNHRLMIQFDFNQSNSGYSARVYAGSQISFLNVVETPASRPNLSSWGNNKTNNQSTAISVNTNEPVRFNATANQSITSWNWSVDNVSQSNNYDNFTTSWSLAGNHNVSVNAININGTSSSISWLITVSVRSPPAITSWSNNITNDQANSLSVSVNEPVRFNAIANQTLTSWNWSKDNITQSNNYDNLTTSWTLAGNHNVSVNASNINGTTNILTWNVSVTEQISGYSTYSVGQRDVYFLTNWTKYSGNPIINNTQIYGGYWPAVAYDENKSIGKWFIFSQTHFPYTQAMELFYGNSLTNLTHITVHNFTQTWEAGAIEPHSLYWNGSAWYLYYCSHKIGVYWEGGKIGLATSTDMTNWTEYSGNPIINLSYGLADPNVINLSGTLYMSVADYTNPGYPIHIFTSLDGINWTDTGLGHGGDYLVPVNNTISSMFFYSYTNAIYASGTIGLYTNYVYLNPQIVAVNGSWENSSLEQLSPVFTKDGTSKVNGSYYLFYFAKNPSGRTQLGYATTSTVTTEPHSKWDLNSTFDNITVNQGTGNIELKEKVSDYISRWRFDGNLFDENRTSANDGIGQGKITYANGLFGKGINFTGTNWILLSNKPTLNIVSNITITSVFNQINNQGDIFTSYDSQASPYPGYGERTYPTSFDFWNGATLSSSTTPAVNNSWTKTAVTTNGSNAIIYINKVLNGTPASSNPVLWTGDKAIGSDSVGGSTFRGIIDDIRIFNRYLTQQELNASVDNIVLNQGSLTAWYDAGTGNETFKFDINTTTPASTNYTVWYARNSTGSYSQLGGILKNKSSLLITGTRHQKTDVQVRLAGNTTATPELISITFYSQAVGGGQNLPNITSWGNNITNDQSTSVSIFVNDPVRSIQPQTRAEPHGTGQWIISINPGIMITSRYHGVQQEHIMSA